MAIPKQLPIAAAIAGVLAAVGISVKLATSTDPLAARADKLLARETELGDNFENLSSRIVELSEIEEDPGFSKLSATQRRSVHERLAELKGAKSYQDFEKNLSDIPDPKTARAISQLNEIVQRLRDLQEPDSLPDSLKPGGAIQEREIRLADARILSEAAGQIKRQYSMALEAGNDVLKNKNEPKLPERIGEVFTLAKDLKTPDNDKNKLLPGSRLTYAAVFQLAEIKSLSDEWKKLKEKLEPAALGGKKDEG
jgi:hypothetical protein